MQFNEIIDLARADARLEGHAEGRAEGLAEGREEGLAEGREEGLAEGREEGRAEQLFADAARIVASGRMSAEEVCSILGVDIKEYRNYIDSEES